jgi:hypothetical protein
MIVAEVPVGDIATLPGVGTRPVGHHAVREIVKRANVA